MFSTVDHYQTFKPGRGNLKFKHLCKFKKKKKKIQTREQSSEWHQTGTSKTGKASNSYYSTYPSFLQKILRCHLLC